LSEEDHRKRKEGASRLMHNIYILPSYITKRGGSLTAVGKGRKYVLRIQGGSVGERDVGESRQEKRGSLPVCGDQALFLNLWGGGKSLESLRRE